MMQGIVRTINEAKGFAFITTGLSEPNKDYFFHHSDFDGHWNDLIIDFNSGAKIKVEFEAISSEKGPRARSVKRIDFPNEG